MRKSYKEMKKEVKRKYAIGYQETPPNTCYRNGVKILKMNQGEFSFLTKKDWRFIEKVYKRFVDSRKYQSYKIKYIGCDRLCIPIPRTSKRILNLELMDECLNMTNFGYYDGDDTDVLGTLEIIDYNDSVEQKLTY